LRNLANTVKAITKGAATNADDQDHTPVPAAEVDEIEAKTTPLYGGGVLIFDEYGRVKYFVENDVFGKRQNERLEYLWREGLLEPGEKSARLRTTRLSTLHRLRALRPDTSRAQRW
jgi:hypothetical protein